ncbi:hypothetical protein AB733_19410 [Photobacterium swingsii]|uniref:Porin family protein n=1 Tax=Photobacterium swingsii TaxID=680026 RepID=A0A0J8V7H3_9GAMM|nr:porin family protein [Photobacterium swingsii]KMV29156.1 hypothetical protein AB733_19410 [Photobacterium swingsii]PSW19734.1 porin family protein [Photobacterium swingsii]
MKKVLSVAAVALALSATAVQANEGVYVGANYQVNNLKVKDVDVKKDTSTLNLIAGYDFNEYVAVEGNIGLGMSSESGTVSATRSYEFKQGMSYGINAVGKLPLHEMFGLYAKVGYGSSQVEFTQKEKGAKSATNKENIGGLTYAAGFQVNVMPELAITAEYGVFGESKEMGPKDAKSKIQSSGFNVGMKYKF